MDQLKKIIDNYYVLCKYCDGIWDRVRGAYVGEIACGEGCDICCELQSVNRLEAHIIKTYIDELCLKGTLPLGISHEERTDSTGSCPFLDNHSCAVYPARPLICRTHGLILRSTEFPHEQAASCPYNFPSHHPRDIPEALALDIDRVTKNLTNLNMAFCMVTGIGMGDGDNDRIMLRDIKSGRYVTPAP